MKRAPDSVDKLVGQNIRIFRKAKRLSQTTLGQALGVTFQQVQKYENGVNRVGSGRLAQIAKLLDVPIALFFHNRTTGEEGVRKSDVVTELLASPYALRMLRALDKIPDKKVQMSLVDLAERIGQQKQ
jgi:transcriptional regulator with XRE-family HTH domain